MAIARHNDTVHYAPRRIEMEFSFRINGTTTPDHVRDGTKGGIVASVARSSTGLFLVTLLGAFPVPRQVTKCHVNLSAGASPTKFCQAYYVTDSWDADARTLQVVVTGSATGDWAVADPDDNSEISVTFSGPAVNALIE